MAAFFRSYWRPLGSRYRPVVMNIGVIAEVREDVQPRQVQAWLEILQQRLAADQPLDYEEYRFEVQPLRDSFATPFLRRTLWVLLGAMALVLLIASANLANLQFARMSTRLREIAVRAALGAGRWRLSRQGGDPVGKRLSGTGTNPASQFEVVGVVSDLRMERYDLAPEPTVYRPVVATPEFDRPGTLILRIAAPYAAVQKGIERELKVAGANQARPLVVHWDRYLYDKTAGTRTLMRYLVLFAVVGLFLAALGGMVGAILGTRLLRAFLFGITPQDPLTLISVVLLLGAVALLACWWPSRRAARVDPLEALRCE